MTLAVGLIKDLWLRLEMERLRLGIDLLTNMTNTVLTSAAHRLIGEVVQSRRRPLLGPSPG